MKENDYDIRTRKICNAHVREDKQEKNRHDLKYANDN